MMNIVGEGSRLQSVFGDMGALIFAIDHNFDPVTAKSGTPDIPSHLRVASACGVDAVLAHLDVFEDPLNGDVQVAGMNTILQVNALDPGKKSRVMVGNIDSMLQRAVRIDAKMLGIQVDFGSDYEEQSLRDLKRTRSASAELGLPLFIHTYLRNGEYNFEDLSAAEYGDKIDKAIQTVQSLGGRVVKVAFRDEDTFGRAVETAHSLDLRIVVAGGEKTSMDTLLTNAITAMQLGADGITVGRNAFDRPVGNTEPALDISAFGVISNTLSGVDIVPGYLKVPDDAATALLALGAIARRETTDVSGTLTKIHQKRSPLPIS
jgi:fructose-bisphosphate aldolase/2-amino-3,7-dideoxy-D-threo-hept-6-ulosonate synthase